ncbi:metallophosphoesterase [Peptostreptococcus faecalis]|uniref:metallophosphoesterase n=1 Tax=Peptostreptococcus faecalis TaxID=2045015 RepID=UPI000C7A76B4|nr:metallophosphoesterase [Peptostreptococcus faecalis]
MKLFAIGDLHLSGAVDKPMNIFGDNWIGHDKIIFDDWKEKVSNEDVVLIVGDISWASKLQDARVDLDRISECPGKKYLIRGNHDYWWGTATALNKLYEDDMNFMNTKYETLGEYAICGSRGWICPNEHCFEEKDFEIYKREANRLKISLESARKDGFDKFIVIMHYPPTNEKFENSFFMDIINEYKPEHVIYGHIHGKENFKYGLQGELNGVNFHLVSCDYLDFKLKEIFIK